MNKFRIECKHCRTLYQVIGTKERLKGCLMINPLTSICYLCEKEWGFAPQVANLWCWNEAEQRWEKGVNHALH